MIRALTLAATLALAASAAGAQTITSPGPPLPISAANGGTGSAYASSELCTADGATPAATDAASGLSTCIANVVAYNATGAYAREVNLGGVALTIKSPVNGTCLDNNDATLCGSAAGSRRQMVIDGHGAAIFVTGNHVHALDFLASDQVVIENLTLQGDCTSGNVPDYGIVFGRGAAAPGAAYGNATQNVHVFGCWQYSPLYNGAGEGFESDRSTFANSYTGALAITGKIDNGASGTCVAAPCTLTLSAGGPLTEPALIYDNGVNVALGTHVIKVIDATHYLISGGIQNVASEAMTAGSGHSYCGAFDGGNHLGITSTFLSVSLGADTPQSFNQDTLTRTDFSCSGDAALFLYGVRSFDFRGGYMNTGGAAEIVVYNDGTQTNSNGNNANVSLKIDAHGEQNTGGITGAANCPGAAAGCSLADYVLFVGKTAASVEWNLDWNVRDGNFTTGATVDNNLFAADAWVTQVSFIGETFDFPQLGGTAPHVFDANATWGLTNLPADRISTQAAGWMPACGSHLIIGFGGAATCAIFGTPFAGSMVVTIGSGSPSGSFTLDLAYPYQVGVYSTSSWPNAEPVCVYTLSGKGNDAWPRGSTLLENNFTTSATAPFSTLYADYNGAFPAGQSGHTLSIDYHCRGRAS